MKKLFYKITILLVVLFIAQIVIFKYIVPPIPAVLLLENYLRDNVDILYFADSIIDFKDKTDRDQSSIIDALHALDPEYKIADLSHGANQSEVYEAAAEYVSRSEIKPKAVILHINPATFSPVWNMTPGLQFEKEKFYFRHKNSVLAYFYRPFAITGVIDVNPVSEEEYMNTIVYRENQPVGTVREFTGNQRLATATPEQVRDTFIARYMSPISSDHRKLIALTNAIKTFQKAGIEVYTYITPINYEVGTLFVGHDFIEQTERNTGMICNAVERTGVECLNLAFSLNSDSFNYNGGYATEHLKVSGRKFIAKKLHETFLSKPIKNLQ